MFALVSKNWKNVPIWLHFLVQFYWWRNIFIPDQRCHTDVFLMSTNIMDRFLAQVKLPKRQFQLLGASCIFLASKMVEPSPISALTLIKCTADTYDREELLVSSLIFWGVRSRNTSQMRKKLIIWYGIWYQQRLYNSHVPI